jgi:hypothetical protein
MTLGFSVFSIVVGFAPESFCPVAHTQKSQEKNKQSFFFLHFCDKPNRDIGKRLIL